MKKTLFAVLLSAIVVLPVSLPIIARADSTSANKLNARLREQSRSVDSLPQLNSLPKAHLPNRALHVFYYVETNKKGQVVRVRSGSPCPVNSFNDYTYYNAIQTFIRKLDGSATAGVFKLTYDYSPVHKTIRRDVTLIQRGGVNPDALGAVDLIQRHAAAAQSKADQKHK